MVKKDASKTAKIAKMKETAIASTPKSKPRWQNGLCESKSPFFYRPQTPDSVAKKRQRLTHEERRMSFGLNPQMIMEA